MNILAAELGKPDNEICIILLTALYDSLENDKNNENIENYLIYLLYDVLELKTQEKVTKALRKIFTAFNEMRKNKN